METDQAINALAALAQETRLAMFRRHTTFCARIEAFLALPLDELNTDRARMKAELDRIGTPLP
ncbi:hypothetical protein [Massilia glaciei]|uniref:hypothetical protein n=1 Tax=Massilia glaciei TaxID=1524097 RepID=UPI001E608BDB|nr:hypothetical protein [Massilia glaciei]